MQQKGGKIMVNLNKAKTYELPNIGDSAKSFYGKAVVVEDDSGKHLLSYGHNICNIDNNNGVHINTSIPKWDSQTSIRHIKSFLRLFNKRVGSKAELMKMYC